MYKKHSVENGNKPKGERFETTAVVRIVVVETWKRDSEDYVFVGNEVIIDVREKHICTDGASRSACRFGYVSELTARGTAPPLSSTAESSIEQRGYKKVHWKERRLDTLAESSRLVPVMSVFRLDRNGTSVAFQEFHC